MAHVNAMGYGKKARGLDNPQPSPGEVALFLGRDHSMDAVQRLDVSGPVMTLVDPETIGVVGKNRLKV